MAEEQEEDGAAQGVAEVAPEAAEAADVLEEAALAENGNDFQGVRYIKKQVYMRQALFCRNQLNFINF